MHSPILPPHPLDQPGSIKVMLGQEASDMIAANGDYHLAVISHPDSTSPPEANGRLILTCIPVMDRKVLDLAFRVATGRMKAVKLTSAKHSKPDDHG